MKLVSKDKAAELLGVSVRTVERLVAAGSLPVYRVSQRSLRIAREDIDDYLAAHRIEATVRSPAPPRPCRYVPGMKVV